MAIGSQRVGAAYITVEADTRRFGSSLIASIAQSAREVTPAARAAGRRIGDELVDGIVHQVARRIPAIRAQIEALLTGINARRGVQIRVDVDEGSRRRAVTGVEDIGRQIQRNVTNIAGPALGRLASIVAGLSENARTALSRVGSIAGTAQGNAVGLAAAIELAYFAALALVDSFMAVGRELTNIIQLAALLPGALAVTAAVGGTLLIGFHGISDAIDEVFTGKDPKKLDAALKGLSKSARDFVLDLKAIRPWLSSVGDAIQESIFSKLTDAIPKLQRALGSTFAGGMSAVGGSIGGFLANLVDTLSSPEMAGFFDRLFKASDRMVTDLGGPLITLLNALVTVADSTLTSLENFGVSFGRLLENFSFWLEDKATSGQFGIWIEEGMQTLGELGELAKQTALLLGVLFDDANKEGDSFIVSLTNLIKKMREFAASKEGKLALEGIAFAGRAAWNVFVGFAGAIGLVVASLGSLTGAIKRALEWLGILDNKIAKVRKLNFVGGSIEATPRAAGTITSGPEVALIGEAGREAVIPLTDPERARSLAAQAGLTGILDSGGGTVTQIFYLGTEQVEARMVEIADGVQRRSVDRANRRGLGLATV